MSDEPAFYVQVALATPLRRLFDYLPQCDTTVANYPPGIRVTVPFGRRLMTGIVVTTLSQSELAKEQLKVVVECLDKEPVISSAMFKLAQWISTYYHHAYGDTLLNLLPSLLRKGGSTTAYQQRCWQITTHGLGLNNEALARAPKQASLLRWLRENRGDGNLPSTNTTEQQLKNEGHNVAALRELEKKGLVQSSQHAFTPTDCQSVLAGQLSDTPPDLNDEQTSAYRLLSQQTGFHTTLLEGITGSGKTEVYLRCIADTLKAGKQALVMVPEIGLTPQTIDRFTRRFAVKIAIFHSGLNDRERLVAWKAAQSAEAKIIIGTRSGIFAPMSQPGLIIVDEEHDASYKQQDSLRYSARDTAIYRAQLENIPILLGSATPSLESLANTQSERYQHHQITARAGSAQPPTIELQDIRRCPLHEGLSDKAIQVIAAALEQKQQAMVFINRRGFAPLVMCHDCGWHAQCDHCDARLTLHNQPRELRCHHCELRSPLPQVCPRCQSRQLINIGQGTEKTAITLAELFPQYPVLRIDRDTTQSKQALNQHIDTINQGEPAILVGTQMLAKGHHFPALATVVILDIDQGLYHADFRGPEKTTQLLTQVAGRAGRSGQAGKVLIQTHLPDHPLLQAWHQQGYQGISDTMLAERRERNLPPFSYMALVRADSTQASRAMQFLTEMLRNQPTTPAVQFIGPLPALMEKRAGRHRAQLLLKANQRKTLHQCLDLCIQTLEQLNKPSELRWSIDVDPQEVI